MHSDRHSSGAVKWLAACGLGLSFACGGQPLPVAELVVLVDTGTEMPMAQFHGQELSGGIHYDLGLALAQKMGRRASFLPLPRKRIGMALESGRGDLLCMYIPGWLPGTFHWSLPFFPMREVVVSDTTVPRPRALLELRGQPIATVLGYTYPELAQVLGGGLVRDDGPSNEANFRKMAAGRMHHVLTQQSTLDYHLKKGVRLSMHAPLLVKDYLGQCAVSPQGRARLAEVNKAIVQVVRDGTIKRIAARYQ